MGVRGTKSAAQLSVASLDVAARRLKAPADLPAPCAAVWREVVDSLPAERFHKSDTPLLALYCRSVYQASTAFAKLERDIAERERTNLDPGVSPWQRVAEGAVKMAATLASKLRLCPQARIDPKTAGPSARTDHSGPLPWPTASEIPKEN